MLDHALSCTGRIACLGGVAAEALRFSSCGRVAAVFERSFYVEVDGAWLCFGPMALGLGPLNVCCVLRDGLAWPSLDIGLGSRVRVTPTQIGIGSTLALWRNEATIWTPPPASETWTATSLETGLNALDGVIPPMLPDDGLGVLALPSIPPRHRTALVRTAFLPLAAVTTALPQMLATCRETSGLVSAMRQLIGLGPGLTPSGDDVLGGLLLTLHLLGRGAMGLNLFARLRPQFESDSNPISTAHVRAAAAGAGSAALHQTINAVLAGDRYAMADGLRRLDALGHTSGWDTLAGAVLVLRAYVTFARTEVVLQRTDAMPDRDSLR